MGAEGSSFPKIYAVLAGVVLVAYLFVETRGIVFAGTDSKFVPIVWGSSSSGGSRSGGRGFTGGYFGGK